MFFFLRMWGGPVWPNEAYADDPEHPGLTRSRGYYHVMLDLDNNPATGWDSRFYEAHETPLGYLMRTQPGLGFEHLGCEAVVEIGYDFRWPDEAAGPGIKYVAYWVGDYQDYLSQTDTGSDYTVYDAGYEEPDTTKATAWQGSLVILDSDSDILTADTLGLHGYFFGHAWAYQGTEPAGDDFVEFAHEITPMKMYWADKGSDFFNPGDEIGICGFTETPIDGWGVDISTRGMLTLPEDLPERPTLFTFDGDSSDWQDMPIHISWVENPDGLFPEDVGAAVTDRVDIRHVRVHIDDQTLYFFLRMWGGPVWPNEAYADDPEHPGLTRSRGYYHILVDLDNDPATGFDSRYYEAHETPVGYLMRTQPGLGFEHIGAELMTEIGYDFRWPDEAAGPGVKYSSYWSGDYSEYLSQTDTGSDYTMYDAEVADVDSSKCESYEGYCLVADCESYEGYCLVEESDMEGMVDGRPFYAAHAWGYDFVEVAHDLYPIKKYWMLKDGSDVFQPGQTIGFCGFNETPIDGWGTEFTTRGEVSVVSGIFDQNQPIVADEFVLENNYPNPFNPVTTIDFKVPKTSDISIVVYNTLGQKVRTLVDASMPAGKHSVTWDGKNDIGNMLPTGMYFYTLEAAATKITKKMVLIK
jgi:hypothetical protein